MDHGSWIEQRAYQVKEIPSFKKISFDSRAIALNQISKIAYFVMTLFCYKAVFTVLKFFHLVILTFKESLFGNRKYNWGTPRRVWELFLNVASNVSRDWGEASLLY